MKQRWAAREVESECEDDFRVRLSERDGAPPFGRTAADAESPEARGLEEPELVTAELARLGRLGRTEVDRNPEANRLDRVAPDGDSRWAIRRSENDPWHSAKGDVRAEEEDCRLVREGHIRAEVQLRERAHAKRTEAAAAVSERDEGDEVLACDRRGFEA